MTSERIPQLSQMTRQYVVSARHEHPMPSFRNAWHFETTVFTVRVLNGYRTVILSNRFGAEENTRLPPGGSLCSFSSIALLLCV